MTTTYSNTDNSKLVIWTAIFIGVIGIGVLVLRFLFKDTVNLVVFIGLSLIAAANFYEGYLLRKICIDEDSGTITDSVSKKYPIRISDIATVTFKESKKGKFRRLFIHDNGVGFMEIRTTEKNAKAIAEQLTRLNPEIAIKRECFL